MEDEKKYFWMRLKADFFEDDAVDYILEQENGADYILIYLRLCLKSLKTDGLLYRSLGDEIVPYTTEKISKMLNVASPLVTHALRHLRHAGLIRVTEGDILSFPQVRELVGSEAANNHAQRQKRYRERKRLEKLQKKTEELPEGVTNGDGSDATVGDGVTSRMRHESVTIDRDRERDIDRDIDRDRDDTQQSEKPKRKSKPKPQKNPYGKNQNVMLSDQELETFKEEQPEHWQRFIDELSGWLKANKVTRRDYLKALRNWAERDYNGYRFKRHDPDTELEEIEQTIKTLIY